MRDVAARAGVSAQTVSNYVNGRHDFMAAETRERLGIILEEMQYVVDHRARNLRAGITRTLGFHLLGGETLAAEASLTAQLLAGASDYAREHSYRLLVQTASTEDPARLLEPVLERQVDGSFLVLAGPRKLRRMYLAQLAELDTPFVVFDEPTTAQGGMSVMARNKEGAQSLASHLIERGHRRIGFIGGQMAWPVIEQRHAGYRSALKQEGLGPIPEIELFDGASDAATGRRMTEQLLALSKPPSAIMATNDLVALGALRAARERGLRVPEDLAIAGFDDFEFTEYLAPALTTVSVPGYDMGRAASEMLIRALEGEHQASRAMLPTELKVRAST